MSLKRISLVLVAAAVAYGQCTVTPSSVAYSPITADRSNGYGQAIQVGANCGTWTASIAAAPGSNVVWFVYPTSGTGATTIYARPSQAAITNVTVGSKTATLTITGNGTATATLTLPVVAGSPLPVVSLANRVPESTACTYANSVYKYSHREVCTFPTTPPASGSFVPPASGSFTDPVYGGRVTAVAPRYLQYAKRNFVSAYDPEFKTYFVVTAGVSGSEVIGAVDDGIYLLDGSGKKWPHPYYDPSNESKKYRELFFSSVDSRTIYSVWEDGLYKQTLLSNGTIQRNGKIWNYPDYDSANANKKIEPDGYQRPTKDDYYCAWPRDKSKLYLINLRSPSQFATFDLSTLSPPLLNTGINDKQDILFCAVSPGVDANTGKRYIRLAVTIVNQTYKAGRILEYDPKTNTISHLVNGPATPEFPMTHETWNFANSDWLPDATVGQCGYNNTCLAASHSSEIEVGGIQSNLFSFSKQVPFYVWASLNRYSSGKDFFVPSEGGGGESRAGISGDYIVSARSAPITAAGVTNASGAPPAYRIGSLSATNPAVASLTFFDNTAVSSTNLSNGDTVLVAGAQGLTALNSVTTVTSVSGGTVTLPIDNTANTYTAKTAWITKATGWSGFHTSNVVIACRVGSWATVQCRKLAHSYAVPYNGFVYQTWANIFIDISPDGKYVVWTTNRGLPGNITDTPRALYTYAVPTGFDTPNENEFVAGRGVKFLNVKADGTATLLADVPDASVPYTCTWSKSRDLSNASTATLSGSTATQTFAVTGLTSKSQYFWRCTSSDNYYAAIGTFVVP